MNKSFIGSINILSDLFLGRIVFETLNRINEIDVTNFIFGLIRLFIYAIDES